MSVQTFRTYGKILAYIDLLKVIAELDGTSHLQTLVYLFPTPTVVKPLRQFGSRHPLRCYSKITFK